jgi:hypothetical protein
MDFLLPDIKQVGYSPITNLFMSGIILRIAILHFYLKDFCATMGNFHNSESRQPRKFNLYHNGMGNFHNSQSRQPRQFNLNHNGMANFHNSKSCQSRQFNLNHNGIGNFHNSESPHSLLNVNRF